MSNIDKQALRERYSAKPTPKCDICGAEMTIQRMSGSRVTYGCSGAIYDETGCHYAEGRSLADDHYEQSRLTVTDESDPDVLALLDELEAAEKRIAELEAIAKSVKFHPIPMVDLGNRSDGKKHPYMFGAGYNSAVVHCESVLLQAFAAAAGKGEAS